jgi:hypothetical protein
MIGRNWAIILEFRKLNMVMLNAQMNKLKLLMNWIIEGLNKSYGLCDWFLDK